MDLSIIIPVYNSEKIIENLIKQITISVDNIKSINSYEIILIEDYSPDKSWEKIELLSRKYSNVKGISLSENFGQHNAIMAGIKYSSGEKIITPIQREENAMEAAERKLYQRNANQTRL